MLIIKGNKRWRFPDSQIKQWDNKGNVEYQNIHYEFKRKRPSRGERFIPDNPNNFDESGGVFINNYNPELRKNTHKAVIKNKYQQSTELFNENFNEDKVLAIYCAYNEKVWLPLQYEWCKQNGVEMYIVDHMSDDGTWEWIQENDISSHRYDNGGSFNLDQLQNEMLNVIHEQKPKWIIYGDCDTFFQLDKPMNVELNTLESRGLNALNTTTISLYDTGEENIKEEHPVMIYKYGKRETKKQIRVCRYSSDVSFSSDFLIRDNLNPFNYGFFINYGGTRGESRLHETLNRRRKAWDQGLSRSKGGHYLTLEKNNYTFDKKTLMRIDTDFIIELKNVLDY